MIARERVDEVDEHRVEDVIVVVLELVHRGEVDRRGSVARHADREDLVDPEVGEQPPGAKEYTSQNQDRGSQVRETFHSTRTVTR